MATAEAIEAGLLQEELQETFPDAPFFIPDSEGAPPDTGDDIEDPSIVNETSIPDDQMEADEDITCEVNGDQFTCAIPYNFTIPPDVEAEIMFSVTCDRDEENGLDIQKSSSCSCDSYDNIFFSGVLEQVYTCECAVCPPGSNQPISLTCSPYPCAISAGLVRRMSGKTRQLKWSPPESRLRLLFRPSYHWHRIP